MVAVGLKLFISSDMPSILYMKEKRATHGLKRAMVAIQPATVDHCQNILNQNRIITGVASSMTEVVITRLLAGY